MLLNSICRNLDRDLIVFIDEADCLSGAALIAFLTQIRAGYLLRHQPDNKFPRSMALIGLRDIRDCLTQAGPEEQSFGLASLFNIIKESLTLADFTCAEIKTLYSQHTEASGQKFTDEAVNRAWHWTEGQPWLVSALAYEAAVKQLKNDYTRVIAGSDIDQAAEALIQRRDTHLEYLSERLKEPRIRRVLEPIIAGDKSWNYEVSDYDIRYAADLGLIKSEAGGARPANPIYGEVIIRTLTQRLEMEVPNDPANRWMDGQKLDMTSLLQAFQQFWRENSEMLIPPYNYTESAPLLAGLAYLQRVLNGRTETLTWEYSLGRRRLDFQARYQGLSYPAALKISRQGRFSGQRAPESLEQFNSYMGRLGAKTGWLVIFDQDPDKSWEEKITWETQEYQGNTIHIAGC
jgi:predicted GIY-YIG superfamily endonuclease